MLRRVGNSGIDSGGIDMNKYNARKTIVDGIKFDSRKESLRYCELKILLDAGIISKLELQPEFILQDTFTKNGKKYRAIKYRADFQYAEDGKTIIEDVKGMKTPVYKIKKKMFEYAYPDLTIKEI
jgi:hypothetical protein